MSLLENTRGLRELWNSGSTYSAFLVSSNFRLYQPILILNTGQRLSGIFVSYCNLLHCVDNIEFEWKTCQRSLKLLTIKSCNENDYCRTMSCQKWNYLQACSCLTVLSRQGISRPIGYRAWCWLG